LSSVVVESTADNPITKADFTEFDTTELSNAISQDNFNASGWNEYVLNSSGTSSISKTGLTKLALIEKNFHLANSAPSQTAARYMAFYSSRHTGSDYDPYLIVNTYTPEEEEENPTASSTVSNEVVPCTPMTNNDLSLISGCAVAINGISTTTYSYVYHIPFIVWAVLFMIFNFIFGRLLLEFIIILRRK